MPLGALSQKKIFKNETKMKRSPEHVCRLLAPCLKKKKMKKNKCDVQNPDKKSNPYRSH